VLNLLQETDAGSSDRSIITKLQSVASHSAAGVVRIRVALSQKFASVPLSHFLPLVDVLYALSLSPPCNSCASSRSSYHLCNVSKLPQHYTCLVIWVCPCATGDRPPQLQDANVRKTPHMSFPNTARVQLPQGGGQPFPHLPSLTLCVSGFLGVSIHSLTSLCFCGACSSLDMVVFFRLLVVST
jgi:hypothetical protein